MKVGMFPVTQTGLESKAVTLSALASPADSRVLEGTCANCNLRETCLSGGVPAEDLERVEKIVYARRRIRQGERLFSEGDEFRCLYAVRSGSFKTTLIDSEGREQITGFFMTGELLGMEGLGIGRCGSNAIALEDCIVCAMPYPLIERISREIPSLHRRLHSVLAREIMRGHGIMMLLGAMSAEARLATFLLNLSKRFAARGYSPSQFQLRMTREEIGSFLGLKLETVSRNFTKLHERRIIEVRQKQITIVDIKGLERILASGR